MKTLLNIIWICCLASSSLWAQGSIRLIGSVIDQSTGLPLHKASVRVSGKYPSKGGTTVSGGGFDLLLNAGYKTGDKLLIRVFKGGYELYRNPHEIKLSEFNDKVISRQVKLANTEDKRVKIIGIVKSRKTGQGVEGAKVTIKGSQTLVKTDSFGNYKIVVPKALTRNLVTLVFRHAQYQQKEKKVKLGISDMGKFKEADVCLRELRYKNAAPEPKPISEYYHEGTQPLIVLVGVQQYWKSPSKITVNGKRYQLGTYGFTKKIYLNRKEHRFVIKIFDTDGFPCQIVLTKKEIENAAKDKIFICD